MVSYSDLPRTLVIQWLPINSVTVQGFKFSKDLGSYLKADILQNIITIEI